MWSRTISNPSLLSGPPVSNGSWPRSIIVKLFWRPYTRLRLVTGGGRGIGAAICLALAADGWDVAVNFRGRAEDAEWVVEKVRTAGRRAMAIAAVAAFLVGPVGSGVNGACMEVGV